jgi:hypothetical protein
MPDPEYPQYIERGGMQCHLQPFRCQNTRLYGFFVEGDVARLQSRIVDPCLNRPANGATDYRALSSHVLVTFATVGEGSSTLPPDREMGWIPELSCTLWVLTAAVKKELGVNVAERLAFFVPYIVVDNAWSMAAGREIYGFPKEIGILEMPSQNEPPSHFRVATTVLPRFGPQEEARTETLLEVTRADGLSDDAAPQGWADLGEATHALASGWMRGRTPLVVPGLGLLVDLYETLTHEAVPAVFLKQFRDVADGRRACYQAIIESAAHVTALHRGGFLPGRFTLRAANFASHPIVDDLGLAGAEVAAELPFFLEYDFEIGAGKEVWRANRANL